ncbi:YdeI/OmpD-associated family protein [Microbacterium sp. ET2]|uniref:YdeI/OmpD-associated family protein n=1 Tax=Microbacterium albipurpureum TaxID=3050384 RepID=UPI00259C81BB|nr:YdeI/OmpD-associated family protein [Microbacterium sp. ET2 (Ac-2212)]WJL96874.1 YdeI/OmpD-associated family protein [Microbacterium sp. ET2 (Ac-2212)]
MSESWPLLGDPHEVTGFIEPMVWGRSRYTVLRVPASLVAAAEEAGTRRVAGRLEDVAVNLALTRAPVIDDTFVWTGSSLLRRLRLEAGDPVTGWLAPVDPDEVPVPEDLAEALAEAGLRGQWDQLPPATRRRQLVPIDGAATAATRARRIEALVRSL